MDLTSLSKMTVPMLKKELKDRDLPLGGVKADLINRLYNYIRQQQLQEAANLSLQFPPPPSDPLFAPPSSSWKVLELCLGYVDPRDSFGCLVNEGINGESRHLQHGGFEWGFYCTKSMDFQVWSTIYLKCLKQFKEGSVKKRILDDAIPPVEAIVEFPTGKKVRGILNAQNGHKLYLIKSANKHTLMSTYGAKENEHIPNVKIIMRTLNEAEARQAAQRAKVEQPQKETPTTDWGIYGQLDSDDENRSDYETDSDYSDDSDVG